MDYLFALQSLREAAPDLLNTVFLYISEAAIYLGPVIGLVIYWCFSKKTGQWTMLSFGWGMTFMDTLKMIACVPRPWLLDSRLHLGFGAEGSATGYSFPSGHTTCATVNYGSAGVYALNKAAQNGESAEAAAAPAGESAAAPAPQADGAKLNAAPERSLKAIGTVKRKHKGLAGVLFAFLLLTAFARNWLGAHTLADVLVALLVGIGTLVAVYALMSLVEKRPKADIWVALGMLVAAVGVALFAHFGTFPQVYDLAGNPIEIDNYEQITDLWQSLGMVFAIVIGWIVERRFINFSVEGSVKTRVIRGLCGLAAFALVYFVLSKALVAGVASLHLRKFLARFISLLTGMLLVPLGIKLVQNAKAKKAQRVS